MAAVVDINDDPLPVQPALAQVYIRQKHAVEGFLLSEKLDGMRAFWVGDCFFSRSGKLIEAPDSFTRGLPRDIVLDGELWKGRGEFQDCISITRNKKRDTTQWKKLRFMVFDTPGNEVYADRMCKVANALRSVDRDIAQVHSYHICAGDDDVRQTLAEIEHIGGEGIILRDPTCGYPSGRTAKLLKVKSSRDQEAIVLDHINGKGKHATRLGALLCKDIQTHKHFKIGSGFTDAQREDPPAIGSTVTYKFFELTRGGIPRFPIFVRQHIVE